MDGITKDSIKTAKLMKQLWPQLTDKEAIDEVKKYTNGKNTAIFTEVEGDTIVGLALCSLRFDYVEGCKYSPVGFLEGIIFANNRLQYIIFGLKMMINDTFR